MLGIDHQETPVDLKFRVGSIPVRIHPFFWLTCALLGWPSFTSPNGGIGYLLLWIGCCLVSVLLHELGHVWMGMVFGTRGHIVLWSFGGVAIGSNDLRARWQRIAVSLAGPGIQLVLWVLLCLTTPWIMSRVPPDWELAVEGVLYMLAAINLYWPLLNLLPVWPLDGGMVTRELCEAGSRNKGLETSLYISIGVSAVLALHCLMSQNGPGLIPQLPWIGGTFTGIFFAMFCIQNVQELQIARSRRRPWSDDDLPWDR